MYQAVFIAPEDRLFLFALLFDTGEFSLGLLEQALALVTLCQKTRLALAMDFGVGLPLGTNLVEQFLERLGTCLGKNLQLRGPDQEEQPHNTPAYYIHWVTSLGAGTGSSRRLGTDCFAAICNPRLMARR